MADLHFILMTLAVSLVTPLCCEAQQVINMPGTTLLVGTSTSIPCGYDGKVSSVEWQKGELGTLTAEEYVVMLDARYNPGKRTYFLDRFNVTADSALTIAGVRVEDEGRYFCTVFDDSSGTFTSSATDVLVESPPTGPFPTIDVCKTTQNCTHMSSAAVNLTCSVDSYFPNISLVFLHDQEIMAALSSKETSNSDGTRNKEISILAAPSDEPYVCKAFRIPGMDGWKAAVVMISSSTEWKAPNTTLIIAVAATAGLLVAVAVAASIMVCFHRKGGTRKPQDSDEESQKQPLLPLTEKWTKPITSSEVQKFASHLTQRYRTRLNSILSTGKAGTQSENKPREDKLGTVEENMFDTPKMIQDWIAQQDGLTHFDIRCKLWEAAIKAGCYYVFDGSEPYLLDNMKCGDNIHEILGRYQRNYISENEIKQSMKYLKQENKYQVLEKLKIETSEKMTDEDIVRKLCNWQHEGLSTSDVELRKLFYDTVNELECQVFAITDDELHMVADNLKLPERKRLITSLDVSLKEPPPDESLSKEFMYDALQKWRESSSHMSSERRKALRTLLHTSCPEFVAEPKVDFVFNAEIPDIGFAMLMEDILPFSEALGLDTARLHKYRKPPTARCVVPEIRQLVKDARKEKGNTRAILCERLVKAGFTDIAWMLFFGQDQSLSEMYVISSNLNKEQVSSLMEKLGLTPEDIDSCRKTTEKRKLLEVIKRWRRKGHPPPYYYREELANAIKHATRHQEFAAKMLEEIETTDLQKYVDHLNEVKIEKLASRLGISDAEFNSVTDRKLLPFPSRKTDKLALIKIWRNKLHPAWYNYTGVFGDAIRFVTADKEVSSVGDNISPFSPDAEESTEVLLERLPDMTDEEVTLVASCLGIFDVIDSSRLEHYEKLEFLKCWKKKIYSPLYHYRLQLVKALQSVDNLKEYANGLLSGNILQGGLNLNVMRDIYSNPSEAEMKKIKDILDSSCLYSSFHLKALETKKYEEQFRLRWNVLMDKLFNDGFSALAHEFILVTGFSSGDFEEKRRILSELLKLTPKIES